MFNLFPDFCKKYLPPNAVDFQLLQVMPITINQDFFTAVLGGRNDLGPPPATCCCVGKEATRNVKKPRPSSPHEPKTHPGGMARAEDLGA